MSKQHEPAEAQAQKPATTEAGEPPKSGSRPQHHKPKPGHDFKFNQKKATARRQLPSGPLGGSGRKTNASRSS
jgi:hypothetical protein